MKITVETLVKADPTAVWAAWNTPDDIQAWNAASDDWHTPTSSVDLRVGGRFTARMEARDGSMGFDFGGTYTRVEAPRLLEFRMDDGRMVLVQFDASPAGVHVVETFDAETENPAELQRQGWQAILDSFARHVETKTGKR